MKDQYYLIAEHGEVFGSFPTIEEAKASMEQAYSWEKSAVIAKVVATLDVRTKREFVWSEASGN